jgi:hypothetical protein
MCAGTQVPSCPETTNSSTVTRVPHGLAKNQVLKICHQRKSQRTLPMFHTVPAHGFFRKLQNNQPHMLIIHPGTFRPQGIAMTTISIGGVVLQASVGDSSSESESPIRINLEGNQRTTFYCFTTHPQISRLVWTTDYFTTHGQIFKPAYLVLLLYYSRTDIAPTTHAHHPSLDIASPRHCNDKYNFLTVGSPNKHSPGNSFSGFWTCKVFLNFLMRSYLKRGKHGVPRNKFLPHTFLASKV